MAHNIREHDSMISVGQRPWHGLGVNLAEPPKDGQEALRLASLDWRVTKVPMYLSDGRQVRISGAASRKNDGHYGTILREDTSEQLGVVGPGYTPYQNQQMAKLFDPLIADGTVRIETCGSLFNGRRVWMLAKFNNGDSEISSSEDTVARYLMLAHGHDGTLAVRFGFTFIRVVCWNTMSLAMTDNRSKLIRCLHTSNLERNLETLRDAIDASQSVFELTADDYRRLASRGVSRVDLREYARILVEAPKEEADWTAQQRRKVGQIVGAAMEGIGNKGRTWWDAYNGATEYLTWTAGRRRENRLDSLWFGTNADLNQKALGLALEMSVAS
jgi:phage/plasmid-like protein (TIGR03299 family)